MSFLSLPDFLLTIFIFISIIVVFIIICPDLHSLVEDAAADLNHLQVLLLLVPRTLDVGHPAPLVLLTGIDEEPDRTVLIKHLRKRRRMRKRRVGGGGGRGNGGGG